MKRADAFPSKYLSARDLDGAPHKVTIRKVEMHKMRRDNGEEEEKPVLFFQELDKPMVLNVTNWDSVEAIYGEESNAWIGQEIVLFEGTATFRGKTGPALRIRAVKTPKAKQVLAEEMDDEVPW